MTENRHKILLVAPVLQNTFQKSFFFFFKEYKL